jgi:uncharacterized OB-fold protein
MTAPVNDARGSLPCGAPQVNPETAEFWAGTKRGELLLSRCPRCGLVIWYPRAICPDCHSYATEWITAAGTGTIYTFTVIRRTAPGRFADAVPYVVAYVELTEGPRMLTNIIGCDPGQVQVGSAVSVVFDDAGDTGAIPRFQLAG